LDWIVLIFFFFSSWGSEVAGFGQFSDFPINYDIINFKTIKYDVILVTSSNWVI